MSNFEELKERAERILEEQDMNYHGFEKYHDLEIIDPEGSSHPLIHAEVESEMGKKFHKYIPLEE